MKWCQKRTRTNKIVVCFQKIIGCVVFHVTPSDTPETERVEKFEYLTKIFDLPKTLKPSYISM